MRGILLLLFFAVSVHAQTPWYSIFTPLRTVTVSNAAALNTAIGASTPGTLIQLQPGTYSGTFVLNKAGTAANPIVLQGAPGVKIIGAVNLAAQYTWVWGVDVSDLACTTSVSRISLLAANTRAINNVVHDLGAGCGIAINTSNSVSGTVVYGNIVYLSGTAGYGMYPQNDYAMLGYKYIVGNIFMDAAYTLHMYTTNGLISGLWVEKNIFANGKFLLGGYGVPHHHNKVLENYFYKGAPSFGYRRPAQFEFSDNYVAYGTFSSLFHHGAGEAVYPPVLPSIVKRNEFVKQSVIQFRTSAYTSATTRSEGGPRIRSVDEWNENKYTSPFSVGFYANNKQLSISSLAVWQMETAAAGKAFDTNSMIVPNPTTAKIAVIPNEYEPGRSNVAVFNWGNQSSVNISQAQSLIAIGSDYAVYNPKNLSGAAIATGKMTAAGISLPTPSEFNVFVIKGAQGIPPPPPPVCGNGVVEGSEECDLGSPNGSCPATCSATCVFNNCPPPACNNNGTCDPPMEDTNNCPADCPAPPPELTLEEVMKDIDAALLDCKEQTGIYKYRCLRDAVQVISDKIEDGLP